jgi:tRNA pseudouridine38-40 synthase
MKRIKAIIEYDGTLFHGFQYQKGNISTVQGLLGQTIHCITGQNVTIHVAGRTDAGVHALGQVIHFDAEMRLSPFQLKEALNHFLFRKGIGVVEMKEVNEDFHARFSATWRMYEYRILNRRSPSPLLLNRVWHIPMDLDVEAMRQGARFLCGTHDFQSFRAAQCQGTTSIKTLDQFDLFQEGDMIKAIIRSKSFLHNQVRIMMGTLFLLGKKKWTLENLKNAMEAKKRSASGPTAPPHGLYLKEVGYEMS